MLHLDLGNRVIDIRKDMEGKSSQVKSGRAIL